jgi:alkylation response protein AidB-like acyl-CoA dehydrogenase
MDLEFTEEKNILKSAARNFLKSACPPALMKAMKDDPKGFPKTLWGQMAELGWLGVMIPEEYGGIGGDFLDLSIILESLGEVCCPGPYFSTVVLGGLAILAAGSEEQKQQLLPRLAKGELILALALSEPGAWLEASFLSTRATREGEGYVLDGTKLFVENAHLADYILVAARTDSEGDAGEGIGLFLVDGKAPGVQWTLLKTLAYDQQCEVVFDRVKVPAGNILGDPGKGPALLSYLQEQAMVAKCAEMVGGLQSVLDMTITYAKEREQFGQPIGSFQAVQHHCADMVVDVDGARFITYQAAWRLAEGLPAGMEAAMAKAWTSDAARRVTQTGLQIHGAISYCDEHNMHLYYRKAKAGEMAFGDSGTQLEKVAIGIGL